MRQSALFLQSFLRTVPIVLLLLPLQACTWRYSRELVAVGPSHGERVETQSRGLEVVFITITEPKSVAVLLEQLKTEESCTALRNIEIDYRTAILVVVNFPKVSVSADCETPAPATEAPAPAPPPAIPAPAAKTTTPAPPPPPEPPKPLQAVPAAPAVPGPAQPPPAAPVPSPPAAAPEGVLPPSAPPQNSPAGSPPAP